MSMSSNPAQRQRLVAMRQELISRLAEQRGESLSRVEAAVRAREQASDDWAQADAEQDLVLALSEFEQSELEAIEQAIERFDRGEYGRCIDCGGEIGDARLAANPVALRCIGCQSAYERRHPQPHASL